MLRRLLVVLTTALSAAIALAQARQPFIVGVGDLPGGGRASAASVASADGSVVAGDSVARGLFDAEAFRWRREEGMVPLRPLETASGQAFASAISWDGTIIIGTQPRSDDTARREAFRWTTETGAVGLAGTMGTTSKQDAFVLNVTPEGATIVGGMAAPNRYDGYSWSPAAGLTWLGNLPGGNDRSEAAAISADGRVIVGAAVTQFSWRAFRWTAESGMVMIGPLEGPIVAQFAVAVSGDGSIVAGTAIVDNAYRDGYLWTKKGGFELLGAAPPDFQFVSVSDMTPDGRVIVGQGLALETLNSALIWDRAHGVRDLHAVLASDYGLDMSEWTFQGARGISADGRTIVGTGGNATNGFAEGFVAFLGDPVPCPGDATGDRHVNISDLGVMLTNYGMDAGATESDGDTDNDGDIDTADLQTLITHFGDLCPL